MNSIQRVMHVPDVCEKQIPTSLLLGLLALECGCVIVAGLAGLHYVVLGLIGAGTIYFSFAGRLPAILMLIAISPVVYFEGVSTLTIRTGKWAVVLLVVMAWFLGKGLRGEKLSIPKTSLNLFIVLFTIWGALICILAINPVESYLELFRMLSLFGLFYLFTDVMRSRDDIRKVLSVWIAVGCVLSLFGLYQYVFTPGTLLSGRITSTFENANAFGIFIFLLLPIVMSLILQRTSFRKRAVLGGILVLLLLSLFLAGSRSSLIAAYVVLLSFSFLARKKWMIMGLFAVGASVGFALLYSITHGELESLLRMGRGLALRPILWEVAWRVFLDHPFFGVGFGGIAYVFQEYYPVGSLAIYKIMSPLAANPHNLFLQMGAETGLPGLCLMLWLYGAYFVELRKWFRRTRDNYHRGLLMALWATWPALILHAFFERSAVIGAGSYAMFFWLSAALFQTIKRSEEAHQTE